MNRSVTKQVVHALIQSLWIGPMAFSVMVMCTYHWCGVIIFLQIAGCVIGVVLVLVLLSCIDSWSKSTDPVTHKFECTCGKKIVLEDEHNYICSCGRHFECRHGYIILKEG